MRFPVVRVSELKRCSTQHGEGSWEASADRRPIISIYGETSRSRDDTNAWKGRQPPAVRTVTGVDGLQQGVPTHAYELDQAVADEFLVAPKPVAVPTKFSRQGVKYVELSDTEKEEYEEKFYDDETDTVPDEIDASALNRWLFNEDTVDKVLAYPTTAMNSLGDSIFCS
jgi:hypothetical protein